MPTIGPSRLVRGIQMDIRALLEDRWSKAGKLSGSNDFKYVSTVDAAIILTSDDGSLLTAHTLGLNGTEVKPFLGRRFEALANPTATTGIPIEDSVGVIISGGNKSSDDDDTVRIITKNVPTKTGIDVSYNYSLVGLDITFPVKISAAGFISGEITQNGRSFHCLVNLFIGKKQI